MKTLSIVLATAALMTAAAATAAAPAAAGKPTAPRYLTDTYAEVLRTVVDDDGRVDYAALKADPRFLDEYTVSIEHLSPETYAAWDTKTKLAFWLNVYNALTLDLIVDHYPIQAVGEAPDYPANSIRQIPGAWDTITFQVMGQAMTLDHIENDVLRKEFDEPRIHMALVCAARSCPPLRREPYDGRTLDAQLDDQVRRFLSAPDRFAIDRDAGAVRLSAIFDWFQGDFVKQYGKATGRFDPPLRAVINFIGRYLPDADRAYLEKGDYSVEYLEYDWTLNERDQ